MLEAVRIILDGINVADRLDELFKKADESVEVIRVKRWMRCSLEEPKNLKGYYVYGWVNGDDWVPFYIGRGKGKRAWSQHGWFCEKLRAGGAKVHIYRDGLTMEGAKLVESVLIDFFGSLGLTMANRVAGVERQEEPPLTED